MEKIGVLMIVLILLAIGTAFLSGIKKQIIPEYQYQLLPFPSSKIRKTSYQPKKILKSTPRERKFSSPLSNPSQPKIKFNPYLETYIIQGPQPGETIEKDYVEFSFTGVNFKKPQEKIYFETKLEGVDKKWQITYSNSRKIKLIPGKNKYKFLVRAKNFKKEVDPTPAERIFFANLSEYYGKLSISYYFRKKESRFVFRNNSNKPINISGFLIKTREKEIKIPQANKFVGPSFINNPQDIILQPGEIAYLTTLESPIGISYKVNFCLGYLKNFYNFPFSLPSCPKPTKKELEILSYQKGFSDQCIKYIERLGRCKIPQPENYQKYLSNDYLCLRYLRENFSYLGCLKNYTNKENFYQPVWHIYLNTSPIERRKFDFLKIYDQQRKLVYFRDLG